MKTELVFDQEDAKIRYMFEYRDKYLIVLFDSSWSTYISTYKIGKENLELKSGPKELIYKTYISKAHFDNDKLYIN